MTLCQIILPSYHSNRIWYAFPMKQRAANVLSAFLLGVSEEMLTFVGAMRRGASAV